MSSPMLAAALADAIDTGVTLLVVDVLVVDDVEDDDDEAAAAPLGLGGGSRGSVEFGPPAAGAAPSRDAPTTGVGRCVPAVPRAGIADRLTPLTGACGVVDDEPLPPAPVAAAIGSGLLLLIWLFAAFVVVVVVVVDVGVVVVVVVVVVVGFDAVAAGTARAALLRIGDVGGEMTAALLVRISVATAMSPFACAAARAIASSDFSGNSDARCSIVAVSTLLASALDARAWSPPDDAAASTVASLLGSDGGLRLTAVLKNDAASSTSGSSDCSSSSIVLWLSGFVSSRKPSGST
jgi:hypothetical protein